ncbi:HNH endonuclease [Cyanothece sp. BG0011]|uniref:HNH endonuclease n=1 Tax=Cyanothece sp. BG0011 TaxID=2082950 RepID=UPI000D1FC8FC|nr:HNH endonuclease signature motif containing protein [Cyanothece sp. BG0011]
MSANRYLSPEIKEQIRQKANYLCEYCHTSEKWQYVKFTIDHIIPLNQGGGNNRENLALACFHCNRKKSNKIAVIDSETNKEISLFNPRKDNWKEHFIWSKDKLYIIGLTPKGKATVNTLDFNRSRVINIRKADLEINRHPPPEDPIQQE